MNTPIEPTAHQTAQRPGRANQTKKKVYILLFLAWATLVGAGAWGAKVYTDHLKMQMTAEIAKQTSEQLAVIQSQYQQEIAGLKESMTTDMAKLQTKIDSVNELLAFTKDSASSRTDNSNQLYTQLSEVRQKLDDLKKQLDALQ
ncbi:MULTISPECIES: hypothetical protein [unclassified Paenibacillus]|uniref:hypothetical protein n=1 Tax=unclassified Paenibacillus TaxID=185978 RepID=UPI001AE9A5EC|nr:MULTISPECIES: hypothetical protein [unclassified Paenibacillus]MBP1154433.1 hypothetical protein [Paenibacillus sp. PvP091]MBP1170183.1 hypothetical protein [Paenibacillus sp. PvR098]MBP2441211.1 hypothetical protein [Paenibacillus sp. PvP052]